MTPFLLGILTGCGLSTLALYTLLRNEKRANALYKAVEAFRSGMQEVAPTRTTDAPTELVILNNEVVTALQALGARKADATRMAQEAFATCYRNGIGFNDTDVLLKTAIQGMGKKERVQ